MQADYRRGEMRRQHVDVLFSQPRPDPTNPLLDLAALRRRVGRWRGHYVAGLQHRLRSLDQEARNPRYRAKPWLYTPEYVYGLVALPRYLLAAVSTSEMTAGAITIIEDDHLEHLVGDQTDEYQLATATIS